MLIKCKETSMLYNQKLCKILLITTYVGCAIFNDTNLGAIKKVRTKILDQNNICGNVEVQIAKKVRFADIPSDKDTSPKQTYNHNYQESRNNNACAIELRINEESSLNIIENATSITNVKTDIHNLDLNENNIKIIYFETNELEPVKNIIHYVLMEEDATIKLYFGNESNQNVENAIQIHEPGTIAILVKKNVHIRMLHFELDDIAEYYIIKAYNIKQNCVITVNVTSEQDQVINVEKPRYNIGNVINKSQHKNIVNFKDKLYFIEQIKYLQNSANTLLEIPNCALKEDRSKTMNDITNICNYKKIEVTDAIKNKFLDIINSSIITKRKKRPAAPQRTSSLRSKKRANITNKLETIYENTYTTKNDNDNQLKKCGCKNCQVITDILHYETDFIKECIYKCLNYSQTDLYARDDLHAITYSDKNGLMIEAANKNNDHLTYNEKTMPMLSYKSIQNPETKNIQLMRKVLQTKGIYTSDENIKKITLLYNKITVILMHEPVTSCTNKKYIPDNLSTCANDNKKQSILKMPLDDEKQKLLSEAMGNNIELKGDKNTKQHGKTLKSILKRGGNSCTIISSQQKEPTTNINDKDSGPQVDAVINKPETLQTPFNKQYKILDVSNINYSKETQSSDVDYSVEEIYSRSKTFLEEFEKNKTNKKNIPKIFDYSAINNQGHKSIKPLNQLADTPNSKLRRARSFNVSKNHTNDNRMPNAFKDTNALKRSSSMREPAKINAQQEETKGESSTSLLKKMKSLFVK